MTCKHRSVEEEAERMFEEQPVRDIPGIYYILDLMRATLEVDYQAIDSQGIYFEDYANPINGNYAATVWFCGQKPIKMMMRTTMGHFEYLYCDYWSPPAGTIAERRFKYIQATMEIVICDKDKWGYYEIYQHPNPETPASAFVRFDGSKPSLVNISSDQE